MSDYFDTERAVAEMLLAEVLILNTPWWKGHWPEEAREQAWAIAVNCNDFFMCAADAEQVTYDELEDLYTMWSQDKRLGHLAWCLKKRKVLPWSKGRAWMEGSQWSIDELMKPAAATQEKP